MNFPADHVADGVYIGGARLIYYLDELREAGIKSVLKLYHDLPEWPRDFVVCYNPLEDAQPVDKEILRRGVAFIAGEVTAGHQVLVICGAGISRSSTFVLAYLLGRGYPLYNAWKLLSAQHPQANPAPEMWISLIEHYSLNHTLSDIREWLR